MSALLLAALLAAGPDAGLAQDPLLVAMKAEVARAMTLRTPARPGDAAKPERPYYAEATVSTTDTLELRADLGAAFAPSGGRRVYVNGSVRVGSWDFDQTNFSGGGFDLSTSRVSPPAEEDVDAVRRALWLAFDGSYKGAVETIARKRAYLKSNEVKELIPDFSKVKPQVLLLESAPAPLPDAGRWSGVLQRASAACREFPSPHSCTVSLSGTSSCQRKVSSDGAVQRWCERRLVLTVNALAQAKDGMSVGWEWRAHAADEAGLPAEAELVQRVREVGQVLEAKVKAAPPAEDYVGPVLFTGDAAPAFFLAAVGTPLSAPRAALGAEEKGRLIERLEKHVAPAGLTVVDDPTQRTWTSPQGATLPLFGFYPVDDDGVLPRPVTLIADGVLKTYFTSRVPTRRVKESNGHARGTSASVGSLFVRTDNPVPLAELKRKLVALAKEEDSEFGLLVSRLPRGFERPSATSLQLPNLPLRVHRVYADGREEVVRGYSFKPASFRVLKDLVGVGDDPVLLNTEQLGQQVSVVAPSVLVRLLELTRPGDDSKPPVLPRPRLPAAAR